ncbi:hypothetical protein Anapl_08818 [Anas platyrhynchos]|uniref:Uncharacterized protein n=1 Tax=Anas platyrhynchos TaxID=8839 RepID=R0JMT5_ANAPL|nr:hypothetical protein Anapl_08818 [Anas platyrhynchos]
MEAAAWRGASDFQNEQKNALVMLSGLGMRIASSSQSGKRLIYTLCTYDDQPHCCPCKDHGYRYEIHMQTGCSKLEMQQSRMNTGAMEINHLGLVCISLVHKHWVKLAQAYNNEEHTEVSWKNGITQQNAKKSWENTVQEPVPEAVRWERLGGKRGNGFEVPCVSVAPCSLVWVLVIVYLFSCLAVLDSPERFMPHIQTALVKQPENLWPQNRDSEWFHTVASTRVWGGALWNLLFLHKALAMH